MDERQLKRGICNFGRAAYVLDSDFVLVLGGSRWFVRLRR